MLENHPRPMVYSMVKTMEFSAHMELGISTTISKDDTRKEKG